MSDDKKEKLPTDEGLPTSADGSGHSVSPSFFLFSLYCSLHDTRSVQKVRIFGGVGLRIRKHFVSNVELWRVAGEMLHICHNGEAS